MSNKIATKENSLLQQALNNRKIAPRYEEHQLEFVREINGIAFINDAKSTVLTRTRFSIESIEAPIMLIVGGADKHSDYSILASCFKKNVVGVVYLGLDRASIEKYIKPELTSFYVANDLADAIGICLQNGQMGDAVLFSPGCVADALDNYKSKGTQFRDYVNSF